MIQLHFHITTKTEFENLCIESLREVATDYSSCPTGDGRESKYQLILHDFKEKHQTLESYMLEDKHCLKRNGLHNVRAVGKKSKPAQSKQMFKRDEAGS